MNNVGMPIETTREGNKITKVCVEDMGKILNRIKLCLNQSYSNISSLIHSINRTYNGVNGKFIIGTGVSQPCILDAFDEEIGNNIAFIKAKLNANIKKYNILKKIRQEQLKLGHEIDKEMFKISEYIELDLDGIRKHNPDYLKCSENWW